MIKLVAALVVIGAAATLYFTCGASSSDSGPGLYQHRTINKPPGMMPRGPARQNTSAGGAGSNGTANQGGASNPGGTTN